LVSLADELRRMLGKRLYRDVATYLEARTAARKVRPVAHPASVPVQLTSKPKGKTK
jgi:hypothetical protein